MPRISVIIPYFQKQPGILRCALISILSQEVTPDTIVQVVVVDDGSPAPADPEINGLNFSPPFSLKLITQPNGGVSKARNAGLSYLDESTKYIAFLDSDDRWRQGHLKKALEILEQGADFYFCNNKREGYHNSYFEKPPLIKKYIAENTEATDIISIPSDKLCTCILREFVTQASTIVYKRDIYPELFFDNSFRQTGEDMIFFMQLAARAKNIKFSTNIMVECGTGINLYFKSLNWDDPDHILQVITNMRANYTIKRDILLSKDDRIWIKSRITSLKRNIAFLTLRQFIKTKGKIPEEIRKLARDDKTFYHWFPLSIIQVIIGKPLGIYKPD